MVGSVHHFVRVTNRKGSLLVLVEQGSTPSFSTDMNSRRSRWSAQ
jgi:hypothetical protein